MTQKEKPFPNVNIELCNSTSGNLKGKAVRAESVQ